MEKFNTGHKEKHNLQIEIGNYKMKTGDHNIRNLTIRFQNTNIRRSKHPFTKKEKKNQNEKGNLLEELEVITQ